MPLLNLPPIGLFSGTISISSQMTQCRITFITTNHQAPFIELKLRDDFRCFRSKMCFRTFSTVPLNNPLVLLNSAITFAVYERWWPFGARNFVCTFVFCGRHFEYTGAKNAAHKSAAYNGLWLNICTSVLYYSFRLQHYKKLDCTFIKGRHFVR